MKKYYAGRVGFPQNDSWLPTLIVQCANAEVVSNGGTNGDTLTGRIYASGVELYFYHIPRSGTWTIKGETENLTMRQVKL